MASVPAKGAVAKPPTLGDLAAVTPVASPGTVAWLCAIPCALAVLVAMLVLGSPLGNLVAPGDANVRFLPGYRPYVSPEPTEQGRFLVALCAPVLLSLATYLVAQRRPRIPWRVQTLGTLTAQVATIALVVVCLVRQAHTLYGLEYVTPAPVGWSYFSTPTLVTATAFAALVSIALGRRAVRRIVRGALAGIADTTCDGRRRGHRDDGHVAAACDQQRHVDRERAREHDLPPRLHVGRSVRGAERLIAARRLQRPVWLPAAVDRRTLDARLWEDAARFHDHNVRAHRARAACHLRRAAPAARSASVALGLYLPVLATSFFMVRGTLRGPRDLGTYFGMFPLRYAGPYLLAWLSARQLERHHESARMWPLWLVAGLVLLNNFEFGFPAAGASLAAYLWTAPLNRRALLRLARAVATGLAGALALVSLLTLLRAGVLPRLWRLTDYARLYARDGFAMLPIREPLGLHIVVYLTYVAAIVTATVRSARGASNRVLTGMLAWSGIFGLGAGSYFVGRSHPEALIASFSAWAFSLALLTVVAVANRCVRTGVAAEPRCGAGPVRIRDHGLLARSDALALEAGEPPSTRRSSPKRKHRSPNVRPRPSRHKALRQLARRRAVALPYQAAGRRSRSWRLMGHRTPTHTGSSTSRPTPAGLDGDGRTRRSHARRACATPAGTP